VSMSPVLPLLPQFILLPLHRVVMGVGVVVVVDMLAVVVVVAGIQEEEEVVVTPVASVAPV